MKKTFITATFAAALFASPAFAQTQGVSDTEIKIGGLHDLSGPFAGFSVPAVKAAQLYFDEVNAKGGVNGRKITYIVEDHGYNPTKAVQLANKLVNSDQVFAMLLSLGTPHNLAAFKIQDPKNIINFYPLSAAPEMLSEPLALHFSGGATYYDTIRAGLNHMKGEDANINEVCSMYLPTDFGKPIVEATKDAAKDIGGSFAAESTHKPDEGDFSGALLKMQEAGCDVVTLALSLKQVITVLGTAKKLGMNDIKFLGSSAAFHTAVAKVPGGITDGFYAVAGWEDLEGRMGVPEVAAWAKTILDATGEKIVPTGAILGRSAAEMFVRGLEAAGKDLTTDSLRAGLETLDYNDVIANADVKITATKHQATDTTYFSQITGGSWKTLAKLK
ncbi:MAG: ABC transporter substrate-binding protein [Nitratireductor sp.]|nr:ABC transporter substrate-binding protein [Nitratireductor sp.]MCB1455209.1 ABC transporter substrate-binding protein [Nitratireductor sp.]MCB1460773.1 ABC transporter substrate-binding protein [Nitratireductor sp.]